MLSHAQFAESSSQALLFQKLVSSRAVAMVSLKEEKYEELVSACLKVRPCVIHPILLYDTLARPMQLLSVSQVRDSPRSLMTASRSWPP